ncbi:hypothetical protein ODR28_29320, partial [Escherichia coli]|nr:hypothetical protein [Escherichia coli]MCV8151894.1 hypothetical protein [Escherichia coli]
DVTLKMPAFEWVHVQLHQQKGMISLSPPTICNSASFCHPILLHRFCCIDTVTGFVTAGERFIV